MRLWGGVVDDKLWVDGVYLDYEDAAATLMNAHYSYRIATNFGIPVTLSVMGGAFTRFIHMPFEEGQSLQAGEAFGFALLRGCITMSIPAHMRVPVSKGQSCFATQTCLAQI